MLAFLLYVYLKEKKFRTFFYSLPFLPYPAFHRRLQPKYLYQSGMLVPVTTSVGVGLNKQGVNIGLYGLKVDVGM